MKTSAEIQIESQYHNHFYFKKSQNALFILFWVNFVVKVKVKVESFEFSNLICLLASIKNGNTYIDAQIS